MPNNIKLQLWDWMKRFLEDKLVFGRTFRDSEFFYKFLLQPRQPSFNHLHSGPEGSAAIPTGKTLGCRAAANQNKPSIARSPVLMHSPAGVQHLQAGSRAGSPPPWADTAPTSPAGTAAEPSSSKRIFSEGHHSPDYAPTKSTEGFPSSFSWEVFPDKDITAVRSQPGVGAGIDFYWFVGFFGFFFNKGKKGLKKWIFHTDQTFL